MMLRILSYVCLLYLYLLWLGMCTDLLHCLKLSCFLLLKFKYILDFLDTSQFLKWSEVTQSCLTLCDPMDCSLPVSSVHWIFQARILEWVAISCSLGWGDHLEKRMETHSSILAWKITSTEETGRLQSMGSQRVRHDCLTSLSCFLQFPYTRAE